MKPAQIQRTLGAPSPAVAFWIVVVLLVATTAVHYLLPPIRFGSAPFEAFLNRQAVVRIAYLIPVALASLTFRKRGGLVVLAVILAAMIPRIIWISAYPIDALLETMVTTLVGSLVIWAVETQTQEKELRQQIAAQNERLYHRARFYAQQVTQAQETERQRIARDLHDETIQMLIVLSRRIEKLIAMNDPSRGAAKQQLEALRDLLATTQKSLRRLIYDLHPPTLDHLGLVATIQSLIDRSAEDSPTAIELAVSGQHERLGPEVELALFRIAQEAIHNIQQHAGASQAVVRLHFEPQRVRLVVEDDGQGFSIAEGIEPFMSAGQLGLANMAERARTLNGTFSVRSALGRGTTIVTEIPLAAEQQEG